ncbi:hypothetical protein QZH41_015758 [Actinostola sp. cb2023]|nr:hypothetical protein QZH41_015758 [Actinostola sp. cb2023]
MGRKSQYHLFYMVAPCLVIAILTLASFWIPSESGERIGFVTTLLLGMMVFLLIVPDSLPESSKSIPILGILMMMTIVMVGFTLLATILILRCYHATGIPPRCLRCLAPKFKQTAPTESIETPKTSENDIEIKVVPQPRGSTDEPATCETKLTWQMVACKLDTIFFWLYFIASVVIADPKTPRAGGPAVFVSNVLVENTGLNIWSGPITFTVNCEMTLNSWPFDDQSCTMNFGSFTYGSHLLKLTALSSKGGDIFQESGNWDLNSHLEVEISENDFGNCCPYKFSQISFTMKMGRKFEYHMFYMVAPCLVIAILTLASFWIPSESGERIGFLTTLLLGMMVFLLIVPDSLPESSKSIPILGILMMTTIVMVGFTLLATILILRCYHATGTPPRCLRCLAPKPSKFKQTAPTEAIETTKTSENDIEIKVVPQPRGSTRNEPATCETEFTWQMVACKLDIIFFSLYSIASVVIYVVILTYKF